MRGGVLLNNVIELCGLSTQWPCGSKQSSARDAVCLGRRVFRLVRQDEVSGGVSPRVDLCLGGDRQCRKDRDRERKTGLERDDPSRRGNVDAPPGPITYGDSAPEVCRN